MPVREGYNLETGSTLTVIKGPICTDTGNRE